MNKQQQAIIKVPNFKRIILLIIFSLLICAADWAFFLETAPYSMYSVNVILEFLVVVVLGAMWIVTLSYALLLLCVKKMYIDTLIEVEIIKQDVKK